MITVVADHLSGGDNFREHLSVLARRGIDCRIHVHANDEPECSRVMLVQDGEHFEVFEAGVAGEVSEFGAFGDEAEGDDGLKAGGFFLQVAESHFESICLSVVIFLPAKVTLDLTTPV